MWWMQAWGIETHPRFCQWDFFIILLLLCVCISALLAPGSYDVFCACSGSQQSWLWSSCDNPDILHIHLHRSGIYPHFKLSQNWYNVILDLPLPWMPFCVKTGCRQIFLACGNHADQLGVILGVHFTLHSHFLCALEFHVEHNWLHYY